MDWSKGFSARYYLSVVDKNSWKDIDRIEITGGTVKRTLTDLRESADINCVNYNTDSEQIIRVWLDARQEGTSSHTPIFTGIATSPSRKIYGRSETNALQCYSVLKIAQDVLLPRGWYAPAEANGAALIKNLLSVIGTSINVTSAEGSTSSILKTAIIAESGESNLSMADKILEAIGCRLKLNGLGEISVEPRSNEPVSIFDSLDNDIIELSLDVTYDWYDCPNVYRAVMDDSTAIARDDSPNSRFSTLPVTGRGREIWYEDTNCYLNESETLADYARRKLIEAQQVAYNISYTRRFDPDIRVEDVVTINYPEQELFGNYLITGQTITLSHGGETSEEVYKI